MMSLFITEWLYFITDCCTRIDVHDIYSHFVVKIKKKMSYNPPNVP